MSSDGEHNDDGEHELDDSEPKKAAQGHVSLKQMLKALDKKVASSLETKLKKLSKKKATQKPLEKNKSDLIQRQAAYSETSKDLSKWDPIVEKNRKAKQLTFPLDLERDVLPGPGELGVAEIKPANELEQRIKEALANSDTALRDNKPLSKAEQKYLKAVSEEEAKARHLELQRMRVLLGSYAAKMRRQKAIKSKSYRRLLKKERIKKHVKKVESDKDLLLEEINRLRVLRAKERACLKHKNTGKWAKHAKFRSKYDEQARQAMVEQIGIAESRLKRPAELESSSESSGVSDDDDDDDGDSEDSESDDDDDENGNRDNGNADDDDDNESVKDDEIERRLRIVREQVEKELAEERELMQAAAGKPLMSSEISRLEGSKSSKAESVVKRSEASESGTDDEAGGDDGNAEDIQRRLMSEAFADDDVVDEFKRAKSEVEDAEQPKDVDMYLPGWGAQWTGPGCKKASKRRRERYLVKAPKLARRDDKLGNVIIAESADAHVSSLRVPKIPHGAKDGARFEALMMRPVSSSFVEPKTQRKLTRPQVATRMGARIEPMDRQRALAGAHRDPRRKSATFA